VTDIWGVMYKPSDFDPGKKYPVIDSQYASPLTALTPRHFFQAWRGKQPLAPSSYAELGFIVVSVDARGTAFRSRAFSQAGYGKLNLIGLDDHVAAIRQLAARLPYLDADRVGIIGHSYGGMAVYRAMLEFPDFFKVGIASAGAASTHGMYLDYNWTAFQGRPVYRDGGELRLDPTEVPANYESLDGAAQADRLRGKLLMQFGELDENVPPGQLLQFVAALIRANKDFELLYMPSRDHQFIGEGYVMRRDWDFMVRNLLGREPPAQYELKMSGR
jgi:dipeptidyl-peptidase 4